MSSSLSAFENQRNRLRKFPPFGAVLDQRAMARFRNAVVTSLPAVLGALVRFHQAVMLQLVKGRVEGAFLEVQDASRSLLNSLRDAIAVLRLMLQGFQNQGRQCSAQVH